MQHKNLLWFIVDASTIKLDGFVENGRTAEKMLENAGENLRI
jgi:hypothetical protein